VSAHKHRCLSAKPIPGIVLQSETNDGAATYDGIVRMELITETPA